MAENSKSKHGIGRIVWPLLLASVLLAMWIAYWYFLYDGSTVAVDTPGIETSAGETAGGEAALVSDSAASSDESSENDSDDDSSVNADADADSAAADSDSAAADSDSAAADSDSAATDSDTASNESAGESADNEANTDADEDGGETGNADAADADSSDESASDSDVPSTSADSFAIALNSTLIVADAAAETDDNGLRLYATASLDAPTREVYRAGEAFRLVEPGEDFDTYPVEVAGISWVRVRDEDGLLGWADLNLLASE